jgi:hypothetical protein
VIEGNGSIEKARKRDSKKMVVLRKTIKQLKKNM